MRRFSAAAPAQIARAGIESGAVVFFPRSYASSINQILPYIAFFNLRSNGAPPRSVRVLAEATRQNDVVDLLASTRVQVDLLSESQA